jgi:hypothetical protein
MDLERPKESPYPSENRCKRDADTQARIGIGVINDESQIGDESQIWASIMLARP